MLEQALDWRCSWARGDPLMEAYHDQARGMPVRDDRALLELLSLEGAQAGLSWSTILQRREGYRKAFCHFDPSRVTCPTWSRIQALVGAAC